VCMHIERVHPASAGTIQSCDSPKLGTSACVRTAKKLISASNKLEKVHLIGLPLFSPAPSRPRLADMLLSCLTAAAFGCIELL
jgi:hypothetical protein